MKLQLKHGDCLEVLKTIPDNSIDSIVTDPPYGLSFMNKKWDYDVPSTDIWKECLRVLKPGGHLLSFSGSRTYHRMAVRIEDAGFEIRDQIMWVYGSGFPKSHNIGKAVDKLLGNEREVLGERPQRGSLKEDVPFQKNTSKHTVETLTKGTSEWEGWGTALKPAHEPIVLARKPLSEKTVAENVLRWGTGGINIDDSRIEFENTPNAATNPLYRQQNDYKMPEKGQESNGATNFKSSNNDISELGRWPANIIFDEEAGQVLDQQSGISKSTPLKESIRKRNILDEPTSGMYKEGSVKSGHNHNDIGGASRFFYCPKASKKDRDEGLDGFEEKIVEKGGHQSMMCNKCKKQIHNVSGQCECDEPQIIDYQTPKKNFHPTVKPTQLMEYLIKLVTPKGGTVLDCFLGSGSTGKAAVRNGYGFIGIEREMEYIRIAEARIKYEQNED